MYFVSRWRFNTIRQAKEDIISKQYLTRYYITEVGLLAQRWRHLAYSYRRDKCLVLWAW